MDITSFVPAEYQAEVPEGRFILSERPRKNAVEMDVVFAGGGPAGLSGAIELARLARLDAEQGGDLGGIQIAVLEKAADLGAHCLSGAIVNPVSFRELFPELSDSDFPFRRPVEKDKVYLLTEHGRYRVPTPPPMKNDGNYVASICEIVRWLGEKASLLGVNILPGFPADGLLVEQNRIVGVRTAPAGLDRQGNAKPGSAPSTDIAAKVTVLCEGTRGALAQAYYRWKKISSPAPQIYALGVKELWETKQAPHEVIHTLGWPVPKNTFGGSFLYPMAENLVAFGLVVGLDYRDARLDVHALLQQLKRHPLFAQYLEGGECVEWGAKTIVEGGYHSLPERLTGDGLIIAGDSAGFVNVAALKGIHYAMYSGILAARAIFLALKEKRTDAEALSRYDETTRRSFIHRDLYRTRNMRLAFKSGLTAGGLKAGIMTLDPAAFPPGAEAIHSDRLAPRHFENPPPENPGMSKVDAVFRSGNSTRDDIPSHLITRDFIPPQIAEFYAQMCPAGVFEVHDGKLVIHAANCIDCKTTDILGPRWTPREGGAGPNYRRM